jgi:hypothetical protein
MQPTQDLKDLCDSVGYIRPDLFNKPNGGMNSAKFPLTDYVHTERDVKVEMFLMEHNIPEAEDWWINKIIQIATHTDEFGRKVS